MVLCLIFYELVEGGSTGVPMVSFLRSLPYKMCFTLETWHFSKPENAWTTIMMTIDRNWVAKAILILHFTMRLLKGTPDTYFTALLTYINIVHRYSAHCRYKSKHCQGFCVVSPGYKIKYNITLHYWYWLLPVSIYPHTHQSIHSVMTAVKWNT